MAFSPGGKNGKTLASASRDGTVKLWDLQTRRVLDTMKGHSHIVFHLAFSPDGQTLASDSLGMVKLWDLTAVPQRDTIAGRRVAFSTDGKTLVTWTKDGRLKLWDTATGESRAGVPFERPTDGYAASSSDGTKVAMGTSHGKVWLFDLESDDKSEKCELPGQHRSGVSSVRFSPTGKHLASKAGPELKVWDVKAGDQTITLKVLRSKSPSVAFSPDGRTLAATDGDDAVQLWRAATQDEACAAGW